MPRLITMGSVNIYKGPTNQVEPTPHFFTYHHLLPQPALVSMPYEFHFTKPSATAVKERQRPRRVRSPISRLPHNVLLSIFEVNTNMNEDPYLSDDAQSLTAFDNPRALNVTRSSSQVSSFWRTLIVKAPQLWASVIDLSLLDYSGEKWREEVFRRAKGASLHVKGRIRLSSLFTHDGAWWVLFLDTYWRRIRIFDVEVANNHPPLPESRLLSSRQQNMRYQLALPFLSRSTEVLEQFSLKLPRAGNPLEPSVAPFHNHAPRLWSFRIDNWPGCIMDKKYTWLSQLQHLSFLGHCGRTFGSVDSFYQILSQIPGLQSLSLTEAIASPYVASHRVPIQFPMLDRIKIWSSYIAFGPSEASTLCWHTLNYIVPKPGCSILVATITFRPRDIPLAADVLSRYAENYFSVHRPTHLTLKSAPENFQLADSQHGEGSSESFLQFDLGFDEPEPEDTPGNDFYQILEALFPLSLPSVTDLTLNIDPAHKRAFRDVQFGNFLTSLSSVKTMSISFATLFFLVYSPITNLSTLVFPELEELNIEGGRTYEEISLLRPDDLVKMFFNRRKDGKVWHANAA